MRRPRFKEDEPEGRNGERSVAQERSRDQLKSEGRAGVHESTGSGTEWIGLRRRYKTASNGVLLDIPHTAHKLLFAHDLALVEAAHPHVGLALQTEGKAALDKLHGLFKRNIQSGRD